MHQIPLIDRFRLLTRWPSALLNNIKIVDDFCYFSTIDKSQVIIDVGCANYPQVGLFFAKHNYRVILVDPTKKHRDSLIKIENDHENISYIPSAIGVSDSELNFYEPNSKISGSLLSNHSNSKFDNLSYKVEVLSIPTLLNKINENVIGYLKLDLEGAEFELIANSSKEMWSSINQIYLEFHHHCTAYKYSDTIDCVEKLKGFGFNVFKLHTDVFLFYRK